MGTTTQIVKVADLVKGTAYATCPICCEPLGAWREGTRTIVARQCRRQVVTREHIAITRTR